MSVVEVRPEGPVSIISINRPDRRNAINKQVAIDLQSAFAAFDASGQRVAVLTGAGDEAFSAGADFTDLPELWRCIPTVGITTDKPIIAAVSGWCIGGALVAVLAQLVEQRLGILIRGSLVADYRRDHTPSRSWWCQALSIPRNRAALFCRTLPRAQGTPC